MQQLLSETIESGGIVLTANQRLARELRNQFDTYMQRARGSRIWPTARILPLTSWLLESWHASNPETTVLMPEQEQQLWQQVILASPEGASLLQIQGAASAARDAWSLICEWKLPYSEARYSESEDSAAFAGWLRSYLKRCESSGWIDSPRLMDHLQPTEIPSSILLAGFDEITPQAQTFFDSLGCPVEVADVPKTDSYATITSCLDSERELRAAAEWARDSFEQAPHVRIGIVIGDLAERHAAVDRIFTEVFHPDAILQSSARAFHVSLGGRLSEYPPIHTAFLILDLAHGSLPLGSLGSLLRSPFLGSATAERTHRALLDAQLRQPHPSSVNITALLEASRTKAPLLARLLDKWNEIRRKLPKKALPSAWSAHFTAMLNAVEWPGRERLSSVEYQVVEEWQQLLSKFASLDAVTGSVNLSAAYGILEQLASSSGFQIENQNQPVQILGLPETNGLAFDYLWIAGMTDVAWPRRPNPNPFLPISLQRDRHLPRSTARRELDYAVRTTARLLASSGQVIISYAEQDGDRTLRPSPLFSELERIDTPLFKPGPAWAPAAALEKLTDAVAPAVGPDEESRGGTRILELQAACPFHAFAETRLAARSMESSESGLNARDRGSLLHIALEKFWQRVKSLQELKALTDEQRSAVVDDCITQALNHRYHRAALDDPFEREIRSIESSRLHKLLEEWLDVERRRAPFTVLDQERKRKVTIGGLSFEARIDRIDRLDSGGRDVILDYKTGDVSVAAWEGDRPGSPQLPVYAITHDDPIGALAFAKITAAGSTFSGIATDSSVLPDVAASDVSGRVAEWRMVLTKLAQNYLAGDAVVDPKEFPKTCQFCKLPSLCRIERIADEEAAMEEAGAE